MSAPEQRVQNSARIDQLSREDAVALAHALAHDHDPEFVASLLDVIEGLRSRFTWFGSPQ